MPKDKVVEEVETSATPSVEEEVIEEDGPVINVEEDEAEEPPAEVEETPKGGEEEKTGEKPGEEPTGKKPGERAVSDDDFEIKDDDEDGVVRRIGKLTKRTKDAERENTYLKGQVDALKGRGGKGEAPAITEEPQAEASEFAEEAPVQEDFEDLGDYYKAVAEHSGRTEARKIASENEDKAKVEAKEVAFDARDKAHNERMAKAIEDYPEIREKVIDNHDLAISENMLENIKDSELGPEVALYLADNPEKAEEIYNLSPSATARAIGRIEAGLGSPPEPKKPDLTKAPPPVSPGGGGGVAPKGNGDNLSDDDYINRANEREAKLRAG